MVTTKPVPKAAAKPITTTVGGKKYVYNGKTWVDPKGKTVSDLNLLGRLNDSHQQTKGTALASLKPKSVIGTAASSPAPAAAPVADPAAPAAAALPPVEQLSDAAWLNQDSTYLSTQAALQQALANYGTNLDAQRASYDASYDDGIRDLGFQNGQWNLSDTNTQSGKAFQGQQNDFAARGMLQSSGYAGENENLTRSLNSQLTSAAQARTQYSQGLTSQGQAYADDVTGQLNSAKLQALARRSAQYAQSAGGVLS